MRSSSWRRQTRLSTCRRARGCVSSRATIGSSRGDDDRTQITQIELVEIGNRAFGPVGAGRRCAGGAADLRPADDAVGRDLVPARRRAVARSAPGSAWHGGNSAVQHLLEPPDAARRADRGAPALRCVRTGLSRLAWAAEGSGTGGRRRCVPGDRIAAGRSARLTRAIGTVTGCCRWRDDRCDLDQRSAAGDRERPGRSDTRRSRPERSPSRGRR